MTAASHRCAEFNCCECGRHIIVIAGGLPDPPLCGMCQHSPGWFRFPEVRALIDPTHPGTEPQLATLPEWSPAR